MLSPIAPSPAPWVPLSGPSDLVMVVSTGGEQSVVVAACDAGNAEANAALICAAPEMATAVLTGDLDAARAALAVRGLT